MRFLPVAFVLAAGCPSPAASVDNAAPAPGQAEPAAAPVACPFNPEHTELFPALEVLWPGCPCQRPYPEVGRCTPETAPCAIVETFPSEDGDDVTHYRYRYNQAMTLVHGEAFFPDGKPRPEWEQRCEVEGTRPLRCVVHGERVEYRYDDGGRIESALVDGKPTTFRYDSVGRLAGYCREAEPVVCVDLEHDKAGRIVREVHRLHGETVGLAYLYGDDGSLRRVVESSGGSVFRLSYRGGRLSGIEHSDPDSKDPDRIATETRTLDTRGRVIEQLQRSPRGAVVARRSYRYDCR